MINVSFSLESVDKYYGLIDGDRFLIGQRISSYKGRKGLYNSFGASGLKYLRTEYREKYGFWADFIHPTTMSEGAYYHTLNTYDSARFTFGSLQFAAHVPNGDFVLYFRDLLTLPLAKEYFPDLFLQNNRIWKYTGHKQLQLESDQSTRFLLDYLNPSTSEIEDTEIIQAAKFIHWVQNDQAHRDLQIEIGISHCKKSIESYAIEYNLDGVKDIVCLLVYDIRHQGRAKSAIIINALRSAKPVDALLAVGSATYKERIKTLRQEITKLIKEGALGTHQYDISRKEFIPS